MPASPALPSGCGAYSGWARTDLASSLSHCAETGRGPLGSRRSTDRGRSTCSCRGSDQCSAGIPAKRREKGWLSCTRWLLIPKKGFLFIQEIWVYTPSCLKSVQTCICVQDIRLPGIYQSSDCNLLIFRVKVPACHRLWPPVWLKYSVRTSLSALLPFHPRHRPRAAWCPFSGPGCRGKRSGERRSPTAETLVKTQTLRSEFLSDEKKTQGCYIGQDVSRWL